jgi:hypothetical protein
MHMLIWPHNSLSSVRVVQIKSIWGLFWTKDKKPLKIVIMVLRTAFLRCTNQDPFQKEFLGLLLKSQP